MDNALINYLQLFAPIPASDRELILTAFEPVNYKEGDVLFQSGHVCRQLFFICNGVLRIMVQNEKGNEVTHFFPEGKLLLHHSEQFY
jgi:signal-transduction protein with cAMP-binding, CBS, and nucleotidyltransferase domain